MNEDTNKTTITFPKPATKVKVHQAAPYWVKDKRKRQKLARRMTRQRRMGKQT